MLEDYPPGDDLSSTKESNVVVVQGSFGIVYSAQVVKTKEELEAEEKHNKHGQAWTWTEEDEKEIEKMKKKSYKKGNKF